MSPLLSHDQESRYKAELEKRSASRKQVVIDNVVMKLDSDLVLSSEQRHQIGRGIGIELEGFRGASRWKC